jgi:triosephosphate isomerase
MNSRLPLIAGNWKMFKTGPEAAAAARELAREVAGAQAVEVMIAPPFTALEAVHAALQGSAIALGAQNTHWEDSGAFTGEIAPPMLKAAGCRFVIIGHSERRQLFGEDDRGVNRKVHAVRRHGMVPVVCVGETEAQRDAGQTFSVLDKQLRLGLENIALGNPLDVVVAYEPVWAIGTGKTASDHQAQEVHDRIRRLLAELLGADLAAGVRILYGGSVKPGNVAGLMAMPDIDGALVGGASLDPQTFARIVRFRS